MSPLFFKTATDMEYQQTQRPPYIFSSSIFSFLYFSSLQEPLITASVYSRTILLFYRMEKYSSCVFCRSLTYFEGKIFHFRWKLMPHHVAWLFSLHSLANIMVSWSIMSQIKEIRYDKIKLGPHVFYFIFIIYLQSFKNKWGTQSIKVKIRFTDVTFCSQMLQWEQQRDPAALYSLQLNMSAASDVRLFNFSQVCLFDFLRNLVLTENK